MSAPCSSPICTSNRVLTVRENMSAVEEDKLPDEELLAQMEFVGFVIILLILVAKSYVARSLSRARIQRRMLSPGRCTSFASTSSQCLPASKIAFDQTVCLAGTTHTQSVSSDAPHHSLSPRYLLVYCIIESVLMPPFGRATGCRSNTCTRMMQQPQRNPIRISESLCADCIMRGGGRGVLGCT